MSLVRLGLFLAIFLLHPTWLQPFHPKRLASNARSACRAEAGLRQGRTRYVAGRRLKGPQSFRPRGKPYDAQSGAKSRRNIGQLLVLVGALGIISRERPAMDFVVLDASTSIVGSPSSFDSSPSSPEWAFSTPVIQPGSILMSRPGDSFVKHQQYFHKSVVLMIKDNEGGDMGLIINRPTGFNTRQLGLQGPSWNIWFGGDCEGLRDAPAHGIRTFCLYLAFAPKKIGRFGLCSFGFLEYIPTIHYRALV